MKSLQEILSPEENEKCGQCGGQVWFYFFKDRDGNHRKIDICSNSSCSTPKLKDIVESSNLSQKPKRALEWRFLCEISGIGDRFYDVCFENMEQSEGKKTFLSKFADKPSGLVLMQGGPGLGKTFAAMAVCEFFTRKSSSCIFTTQKKMSDDWLEDKANPNKSCRYHDSIKTPQLLVIDDFGIAQMSKDFLEFFMDVINVRMQWSNRGTMITTNLNDKDFTDYCGHALSDRINTGTKLVFTGKTRRKPVVV